MIDLHVHSTASDGSLSPNEILALAQKMGIKAIALTDHDSIAGVKQILNSPPSFPVDFITGVEISCAPPKGFERLGSIHMLGYGFSVYNHRLNQTLEQAVRQRDLRNPKIIERLQDLGFDITLEEVHQRFGADQTGRPHIAELLVEKGYVDSFRQAFDLYMGKGKPAYVDKFKITCESAIEMILDAGGIPVLAHPGLLDFDRTQGIVPFLDGLSAAGLGGMEVFYTDHDPDQVKRLLELAKARNLLVTGGSDFHGEFNKGVELGRGKGDLEVGLPVFKQLCDRIIDLRSTPRLNLLEANLEYTFTDLSHLSTALCHRSYLNENQDSCDTDNERMEFLGDAVLGLCVGQMLMEADPTRKEGELSKFRSNLVSEPGLARIARQIDLGRFVKLGKGEALSNGYDKNSILSDTFEAVIAAVYLDGGFDRAFTLVRRLFDSAVKEILCHHNTRDHKSAIQEYGQEHFGAVPGYTVNREMGPDHDKTFEVQLSLDWIQVTGKGKTKKAAEQDAARAALDLIADSSP